MNKAIRFCFFLLIISVLQFSANGNTQFQSKTDSLRQVVNSKTGIEKISAQLDLALQLYERENSEAMNLAQLALKAIPKTGQQALQMRAYFVLGEISQQTDNAILSQAYYDSALFLSDKIDDTRFKSDILLQKGIGQHILGKHLDALQTFNSAIQIGRMSGNFRVVGGAYSMMGTIFREHGLYDRAIEYIIKSRMNYEKASFTEGYAWSAYLLGRIYADLQLWRKALDYYQQALDNYIEIAAIDQNKNGVAICYEQITLIYIQLGKLEEARESNKKTLEIYLENNSTYGISNTDATQGRIEYAAGNYAVAEKYLERALEKKIEMNDLLNQSRVNEYLGLSKIKSGKIQEGLNSIEKGLEIAISTNQKKNQMDIYSELADVYHDLDRPEKVIYYQDKIIEIQDELLSGGATIKMEQLQSIYELDAKNAQIADLEKINEINALRIRQHRISNIFFGTGIFMATFAALMAFWFYRRIRQKNRQLHEANAAKDKFFAIIAHDLRGPTSTIAAFIDHIYSDFDQLSKAKLKELLHVLQKSSRNANSLLENLLFWSRSQSNKIKYVPQKLVLNEIFSSSYLSLEQSVEEKEIDFSFEMNGDLIVWADPNMLQTIIRNLLSNAIKFTRRGGKVRVGTHANQGNAIVTIADNGIGIEKDALSTLFDIDNKYRKPGTENEMSTGLGLILVKDFIEKNGGTIRIESKIGKGTTVTFTLPLASGA